MNRSKQRSGFGSIWNAIRYTLYLPIYDLVAAPFAPLRKHSINQFNWTGNERVLISGAGSGLDFRHLPKVKHVDAIDIAPGMLLLMQLRSKNRLEIHPQLMNGHELTFDDNCFDVVILHLILAVIPDPVKALQEVERVVKPGGTILVMDKFIANGKPTVLRRLINIPANLLATSITRNIEELVSQTNFTIVQKRPAAFNGLFQFVVLKKN
jgi:ubiquinone/menaquinone biosynthesis C-methylase UbiE